MPISLEPIRRQASFCSLGVQFGKCEPRLTSGLSPVLDCGQSEIPRKNVAAQSAVPELRIR